MKLSTRLTLVVLGCLVPVLAAQTYTQLTRRAERKHELADLAVRQASVAVGEVSVVIGSVRQLALVLAQFPDSLSDPNTCATRLSAMSSGMPQFRYLSAVRQDGTPLCGSADAPRQWSPDAVAWFRDLSGAGRAEAGLLSRSDGSRAAVLPLAAAIGAEDTAAGRALLVAGLDTGWLTDHLKGTLSAYLRTLPHADLMIVDRNGSIAARLPGGSADGPPSLPGWITPLVARSSSGAEVVTAPGGRDYLAGVAPMTSGSHGVAAIETVAMSNVPADIDHAAMQDTLVLVVAATTALLLAWLAGRRFIYHPTEILLQAANQWREGDLSARAKLDDSGSEFAALASSFNAMAAGLKMREIERELQASMLEARVAERTRALSESNNRLQVEIAGRAKTEAALGQAQKLQAVGQLAGGIAHDFNNMLATVLGNLELMERRFAQTDKPWSDDDRERMLRLIARASAAVQRGARLTSHLLAFSRRQRLTPRSTDINALLRDVIPLAASTLGSRVRVNVALGEDVSPALVDPGQVEAAILNLCFNARDAMPDGGSVSISTGNTTQEDAARDDAEPSLRPGEYVRICIADTGTGMTPDVAARAFEPFFTTKGPVGTGLGLSQVYGMARQSGGDVTIRTGPGEGTRITLYLPRATAPDPTAEGGAVQPAANPAWEGALALVVDDDPDVRHIMIEMLRHLGFRVAAAADSKQALALVATLRTPPALILLDYAMPVMNGIGLARELRRLGIAEPIVLMTGYAEISDADLTSAEFSSVLRKPFSIQDLQAVVARLVTPANAGQQEAVSGSA